MNPQITFLGGGNMASALTAGLLAQGHSREHIHIVQRSPEKREALKQKYHVTTSFDYAAGIAEAEVVVFAVKPQGYPELIQAVAPLLLKRNPIIVSIMSGLRLATLEAALPGLSIVRVMPNTPSRVGAGLTLLSPGGRVTSDQLTTVQTIFNAVGETIITPSERVFEQLTALTGCGPAFVFYLVDQWARAMQAITPEIDCLPLARATFQGALTLMAQDSDTSPEILISQVAPKGGMTAEAMKVLGGADLQQKFQATLEAAIDRGDALACTTPAP
jgi:pyrroline-5-carboxylate reductase